MAAILPQAASRTPAPARQTACQGQAPGRALLLMELPSPLERLMSRRRTCLLMLGLLTAAPLAQA
jgi:hypothetical protein